MLVSAYGIEVILNTGTPVAFIILFPRGRIDVKGLAVDQQTQIACMGCAAA